MGSKGGSALGWMTSLSLKLGIFVVIGITILAYTFGKVVPPGSMGVRQVTLEIPFLLPQGFAKDGLQPGYHWNIPFYTRIHLIPQEVQVTHLHRDRSLYPKTEGAVEVQTLDGSSVKADVSILSRFLDKPGEVEVAGQSIKTGGPSDLITKIGQYKASWFDRIREVSVDELKRSLAQLNTSDFYNPTKREQRVLTAIDNMNTYLLPLGIQVESALLRRYTYEEKRIDDAIFAKNIQNQEERLKIASSDLAKVKAQLEGVAANMDAKIKTLKVEGENEVKVLQSEGDLYETELKAKGNLVVAKAEAEADRLKADVLAKSSASKLFVAREMAPLLNSLSGGVVSDIDPYDIEAWVEKFGLAKKSK